MSKLSLDKLKVNCLQLNYTKWYKSLIIERKNYLKQIGIKNEKKLRALSTMKFNLLPYQVRTELQIKEVVLL